MSKFCGTAPVSEVPGDSSAPGSSDTLADLDGGVESAFVLGSSEEDPIPAGRSSDDSSLEKTIEYAAWAWDIDSPSMEFNIYERKGPGMELLFCTVVHTDGGRKRRSVAQFSVAVSNMREGLRMVQLRNRQTGAFLHGGAACMLVDVSFRPVQDGDILPEGPVDESAAACLGVGRG